MRVLTVQVNQELAQFFALSQRCRTTVDKGSGSTVGGDGAAYQTLVTLEKGCSIKPSLRLWKILYREKGRNFGAISAGSHRFCISSVPDTQTERIEHDRLTRSCLASNAGHSSM